MIPTHKKKHFNGFIIFQYLVKWSWVKIGYLSKCPPTIYQGNSISEDRAYQRSDRPTSPYFHRTYIPVLKKNLACFNIEKARQLAAYWIGGSEFQNTFREINKFLIRLVLKIMTSSIDFIVNEIKTKSWKAFNYGTNTL